MSKSSPHIRNSFLKTFFGEDFKYCLLLLVVVSAAYSMLLTHPVVHDFFNEFFPQRFFQINSIRHRIFPLWNPYQSMGLPAHCDPQASTFYLPVYIFAIFGEYTSLSCGIELIAHVFIAACGFYFLASHFVGNKAVAFLTAVCYSLSGFFVGNAQHLSWIIAGAWLPWCLLYLLRLLKEPNVVGAVKLSVVLSLFFSGAYPGFFFVFFYLALVLFVVEVVLSVKKSDFGKVRRLFLLVVLSSFLFLVLSMPTIISFVEAKTIITRGSALDYSQISESFPTVFSLLVPYSVTNEPSLFVSDLTMRSLYVGLLTLLFAVYGIFNNKDKTLWILLIFGVFSLLVSYGQRLPFHKVVFYTLPFFKVIRMPALMRLFFMIVVVVFAAVGLDKLFSEGFQNARVLKILSVLAFVFAVFSFFLLPLYFKHSSVSTLLSDSFYRRLRIDLAILSFVSLVSFVMFQLRYLKIPEVVLSLLLISDLMIYVFLAGPITMYNANASHSDLDKITVDRGWPVPERLYDPVEIVHKHSAFNLWQNAGCFFKEPEWFSYNPFVLNRMHPLMDFYDKNKTSLTLPVVYSPTCALEIDENSFPPKILNDDTVYYFDKNNSSESLVRHINKANCAVEIKEFKPGRVIVSVSSKDCAPVVLCQSYSSSWKCMMDDSSELEIFPLNSVMMGVIVPEGRHQLAFSYKKPLIYVFMVIQFAMFLCSLVFLFFKKMKMCRKVD